MAILQPIASTMRTHEETFTVWSASGIWILAVIFAGSILSSCSSGRALVQESNSQALESGYVMTMDSDDRSVIFLKRNGRVISLSEPPPDTASNIHFNIGGSTNGVSGKMGNITLNGELNTETVKLINRTTSIQLLRDAMFRINEARVIGDITDKDERLFSRIISLSENLAMAEISGSISIQMDGAAQITQDAIDKLIPPDITNAEVCFWTPDEHTKNSQSVDEELGENKTPRKWVSDFCKLFEKHEISKIKKIPDVGEELDIERKIGAGLIVTNAIYEGIKRSTQYPNKNPNKIFSYIRNVVADLKSKALGIKMTDNNKDGADQQKQPSFTEGEIAGQLHGTDNLLVNLDRFNMAFGVLLQHNFPTSGHRVLHDVSAGTHLPKSGYHWLVHAPSRNDITGILNLYYQYYNIAKDSVWIEVRPFSK